MANKYTLYVDKTDGNGFYRDYKNLGTAVQRHSKNVRAPGIARSWLMEYADDDRDYSRKVADWNIETPNLNYVHTNPSPPR